MSVILDFDFILFGCQGANQACGKNSCGSRSLCGLRKSLLFYLAEASEFEESLIKSSQFS